MSQEQLTYHGVLAPAASWRDDVVPRRARDRRGSRRRWIAAISERDVIVRILEHLGLPSEVPVPAPARAPPQGQLEF